MFVSVYSVKNGDVFVVVADPVSVPLNPVNPYSDRST